MQKMRRANQLFVRAIRQSSTSNIQAAGGAPKDNYLRHLNQLPLPGKVSGFILTSFFSFLESTMTDFLCFLHLRKFLLEVMLSLRPMPLLSVVFSFKTMFRLVFLNFARQLFSSFSVFTYVRFGMVLLYEGTWLLFVLATIQVCRTVWW